MTDGRVSVTVTVVAVAGPLFVTAREYVSGVPSVTGFGDAVFTIAMSALFALATTTVALALLVVRFGTILPVVALSVSVMLVPDGVPETTCSTRVKLAEAFSAIVPVMQVIVPVPPTAGTVLQVHPTGGAMDWKVVFGGVICVNVTPVADAGPSLVTVCV